MQTNDALANVVEPTRPGSSRTVATMNRREATANSSGSNFHRSTTCTASSQEAESSSGGNQTNSDARKEFGNTASSAGAGQNDSQLVPESRAIIYDFRNYLFTANESLPDNLFADSPKPDPDSNSSEDSINAVREGTQTIELNGIQATVNEQRLQEEQPPLEQQEEGTGIKTYVCYSNI